MNKQKEAERQEAITMLLKYIKPSMRVYTILRSRSSSGMSRVIDCKIIVDNEVLHMGYNVARALGYTWDNEREGMKVGGAGMDMGFHIVYSLSSVLFRDNFYCIGKGCPSNDHTNGEPVRKGKKHSDGGYALTHSWL